MQAFRPASRLALRAASLALALAPLSLAAAQTCPVTWSGVGGGLSHPTLTPSVWAQATFDDGGGPQLYVGGIFTAAGGVPASNIARWDGSAWSALGSGVNGQIEALCVFDQDGPGPAQLELYVGGGFTLAGGVTVRNLARWNGSSWSDVGGGLLGLFGGSVSALAVHDQDGSGPGLPALYIGGFFFSAGTAGTLVSNVVRWNGSSFAALGAGVDNGVNAFEPFDDGNGLALYAGGYFSQAGGQPANLLARWDGSSWSAVVNLATTTFQPAIHDLEVFDDGSGPALYVAGTFAGAGGAQANHVARFDGTVWSGVGAGTSPTCPTSFAVWDDGGGASLYAGGAFTGSGTTPLKNMARWNGSAWLPVGVGDGTDKTVLSLATFGAGTSSGLYAGGMFATAGNAQAQSIARALSASPPTLYCTAKVNSQGCTPALTVSGSASASSGVPFLIGATGVINQQNGLLAYSQSGQASIPFSGALLCIQPPQRRTPIQSTGGSPTGVDCSGTLSFDFNAFIASGATAGLVPGTVLQAQYWSADPGFAPPLNAGLTQGVEFIICQ